MNSITETFPFKVKAVGGKCKRRKEKDDHKQNKTHLSRFQTKKICFRCWKNYFKVESGKNDWNAWYIPLHFQQGWGSGFGLKNRIRGSVPRNEGRFKNFYRMNILDYFKLNLFYYHTFGVKCQMFISVKPARIRQNSEWIRIQGSTTYCGRLKSKVWEHKRRLI